MNDRPIFKYTDGRGVEVSTRDPFWIGRDGVAVPDPFDADRPLLRRFAWAVDDEAMLIGRDLAHLDDLSLETLRVTTGKPVSALIDLEGPAHTRLRMAVRDGLESTYFQAKEDALVAAALAGSSPSPEQRQEVEAKQDRAFQLGEQYLEQLQGRAGYLDERVAENLPALATEVAVAREQAVRRAQREPQVELPADVAVREIGPGADVSDIVERRAAEEQEREAIAERKELASHVQRDSFVIEPALNRVLFVLGERRTSELREAGAPLAEWVRGQPDEWVRGRREELGHPRVSSDSMLAVRLETRRRGASQDFMNAKAEAESWLERDPGRAQIASNSVAYYEAKVVQLDAELEVLREQGRHPDQRPDERDRIVRSSVYQDEFETRRNLAIAQDVERSVARPPAHVQELLGAAPESAAPNREEWEVLVRMTEYDRLTEESLEREGLEPEQEPYDRRELDERIDHYREQQGLEPQRPELAIERGEGKGIGM